MSEEILYIDDGELVYYINENEFITCDEIPYPMLEGIKHLQQKVEQLEKENKELNLKIDKAIAYIKTGKTFDNKNTKKVVDTLQNDLLNILNKGSEK